MRVIQVNAVYGTGSTGEIVKGIADVAQANGVETYFACANAPLTVSNNHIIVIGNRLDHKLHAVYSRVFGKQGYASYLTTKKLLKWVDKVHPDIIHLHNLHSNYINVPVLFEYIKERKIQTVITMHDCWFLTGKCCHFLYNDCDRWKTGCGHCPRLKEELPSLFFDRSAAVWQEKKRYIGENPFVHVVGCSMWITEVCKHSILSNRVTGTICNGIDTNVFRPRESSLREDLFTSNRYIILGMAGKWLANENRQTFEYFLKHLREDELLLLIGCTQKQISNLPPNVKGIGFIRDRVELSEIYTAADVFVNVTKVDTFPTVNIEAMACGTPVITYDSGGSAEIVTASTGRVVSYGNYKALRCAVDEIKQLGKKYFSQSCIDLINNNYVREQCFQKYIDLYRNLLLEDKWVKQ